MFVLRNYFIILTVTIYMFITSHYDNIRAIDKIMKVDTDETQTGSHEDQGVLAAVWDSGHAEDAEETGGQDEDRGEDVRGGQTEASYRGDREDHIIDSVTDLQTDSCGELSDKHGVEWSGGKVELTSKKYENY